MLDQVVTTTAYGDFLRTSGGPALFCFSGLDDEVVNIPAVYTDNNGQMLLATDGAYGAGCIAYRSMGSSEPTCCEIKRLFVSLSSGGRVLESSLSLQPSNGLDSLGTARLVSTPNHVQWPLPNRCI